MSETDGASVSGYLSNSKDSSRRACRLVLSGDGQQLSLLASDDGQTLLWAFRSEVEVAPRLGSTPREISFPSQWSSGEPAVFVTADNAGVDRLFGSGGSSGSLLHRMEKSYRWVWGSLGLLLVFALGFVIWGIPASAKWVADMVPESARSALGDQVVSSLEGDWLKPSALSEERQQQLRERLGRLLQLQNDFPRMRLLFRASDELGANALAFPGGLVVITDGLVELAEDDREIAAVLAHELGHVAHKHGLRSVVQASFLTAAAGLLIGDASSVVASVPVVLTQLGYSREFEREADAFALQRMRRVGLEPVYFARIMRRLSKDAGAEGPAFLSTHPDTKERVKAFE